MIFVFFQRYYLLQWKAVRCLSLIHISHGSAIFTRGETQSLTSVSSSLVPNVTEAKD